MYHAKRGGITVMAYAPEQDEHAPDQLALLSDLRRAVERGELVLHFQPLVAMETGSCVSVEALLRWQHPVRGMVPPMSFIPLAEQSGLIREIGLWTISEALRTCATWPRGGPGVAVNLSMRSLRMPSLVTAVRSALDMWRVPGGALTVEVTESVLMDEPQQVTDLLTALGTIGVRASIDDYGTGYSSLAYLKRLPARELKIDRAFISDMTANAQSQVIVRSTIQLAHELGLLVVAEGIEDQATWDQLRSLGCDVAQGFFIARPMPADALRTWLRARGGRIKQQRIPA
jgi:EAL domain-containing protein (putative c-di-GMP-specific phosphodiesterase class I)